MQPVIPETSAAARILANGRCRRCIDVATEPSAGGGHSSCGCAHNTKKQSAYNERRSIRVAVADWMNNAAALLPLGLTRCQRPCALSPGFVDREASFGHANQRTVRCGIGRCGKTPCASCGFPSQCLSQPWARASQTASRRPSLERARCAAGLTHLAGAVCACAAATLIGDRSPSPTGPSCAATVGSTGGENGLAADEPHSNDLKAMTSKQPARSQARDWRT